MATAKTDPNNEEPRSRRASSSSRALSAGSVAQYAAQHIAELTRHETLGATSVRPNDDGWSVEVEVIEESRIPSSADILALFVVDLDKLGNLLSYHRTKRYSRGKGDGGS